MHSVKYANFVPNDQLKHFLIKELSCLEDEVAENCRIFCTISKEGRRQFFTKIILNLGKRSFLGSACAEYPEDSTTHAKLRVLKQLFRNILHNKLSGTSVRQKIRGRR